MIGSRRTAGHGPEIDQPGAVTAPPALATAGLERAIWASRLGHDRVDQARSVAPVALLALGLPRNCPVRTHDLPILRTHGRAVPRSRAWARGRQPGATLDHPD